MIILHQKIISEQSFVSQVRANTLRYDENNYTQ